MYAAVSIWNFDMGNPWDKKKIETESVLCDAVYNFSWQIFNGCLMFFFFCLYFSKYDKKTTFLMFLLLYMCICYDV